MTAPKIPLLGGIIAPMYEGSYGAAPAIPPTPNIIFSPADKALQPAGVQDTFELHLWLLPAVGSSEVYWIYAYEDSTPADRRILWSGDFDTIAAGAGATNEADVDPYGRPIKVLDGVPIRGNVTVVLETTQFNFSEQLYPEGVQVYGYAYRVGQGSQNQRERRFIGEPSSDDISAGLPLKLVAGVKTPLHTFEPGRIDEISLAFILSVPDPPDPMPDPTGAEIVLTFDDANNNPIIAGHQVRMFIDDQKLNYFHDPQSIYQIYQAVFTPNSYTNLDHISVTLQADSTREMYVHGYFNRR